MTEECDPGARSPAMATLICDAMRLEGNPFSAI